jgi:hypothetical protein
MKNIKISIQDGLDEVKNVLTNEGFNVFRYGSAGLDADITIITGVDEAYEEIQPAEYHANGKKPMLVIDATNTTPEKVLERVHKFTK